MMKKSKVIPYKKFQELAKDPIIAAIMKDRKTYVDQTFEAYHNLLRSIGINPKAYKIKVRIK